MSVSSADNQVQYMTSNMGWLSNMLYAVKCPKETALYHRPVLMCMMKSAQITTGHSSTINCSNTLRLLLKKKKRQYLAAEPVDIQQYKVTVAGQVRKSSYHCSYSYSFIPTQRSA